jgi:disulfide bond formation protein DsbB
MMPNDTINTIKLTSRRLYAYLLGFSLLLLIASFILQYGFHLHPCPLCMIDRMLVGMLVLLFGVALWHNPKGYGQTLYGLLGFSLTLTGIATTARHLWILHLPKELAPACTPGIDYLMETFPVTEVFMIILKGSGECAQFNDAWLGVSLPAWTMAGFIVLAIGCVLNLKISIKKG